MEFPFCKDQVRIMNGQKLINDLSNLVLVKECKLSTK